MPVEPAAGAEATVTVAPSAPVPAAEPVGVAPSAEPPAAPEAPAEPAATKEARPRRSQRWRGRKAKTAAEAEQTPEGTAHEDAPTAESGQAPAPGTEQPTKATSRRRKRK